MMPTIGDIQRDALYFYRTHFARIVLQLLPASLLWVALAYAIEYLALSPFSGTGLTLLASMFVYALCNAVTIVCIRDELAGNRRAPDATYREALGYCLPLFLVLVFRTLAIGLGLVLLVVPGIYVAVRLAIAEPIAVLETKEPGAALAASSDRIRGHGWTVLYALGGLYVVVMPCVLLTGELAERLPGWAAWIAVPVSLVMQALNTVGAYRVYSALQPTDDSPF